jgi:hypothetical protein
MPTQTISKSRRQSQTTPSNQVAFGLTFFLLCEQFQLLQYTLPTKRSPIERNAVFLFPLLFLLWSMLLLSTRGKDHSKSQVINCTLLFFAYLVSWRIDPGCISPPSTIPWLSSWWEGEGANLPHFLAGRVNSSFICPRLTFLHSPSSVCWDVCTSTSITPLSYLSRNNQRIASTFTRQTRLSILCFYNEFTVYLLKYIPTKIWWYYLPINITGRGWGGPLSSRYHWDSRAVKTLSKVSSIALSCCHLLKMPSWRSRVKSFFNSVCIKNDLCQSAALPVSPPPISSWDINRSDRSAIEINHSSAVRLERCSRPKRDAWDPAGPWMRPMIQTCGLDVAHGTNRHPPPPASCDSKRGSSFCKSSHVDKAFFVAVVYLIYIWFRN